MPAHTHTRRQTQQIFYNIFGIWALFLYYHTIFNNVQEESFLWDYWPLLYSHVPYQLCISRGTAIMRDVSYGNGVFDFIWFLIRLNMYKSNGHYITDAMDIYVRDVPVIWSDWLVRDLFKISTMNQSSIENKSPTVLNMAWHLKIQHALLKPKNDILRSIWVIRSRMINVWLLVFVALWGFKSKLQRKWHNVWKKYLSDISITDK